MVFGFNRKGRKIRLRELRGAPRSGHALDIVAHDRRRLAEPVSPFPGFPPGQDIPKEVQRFFPNERPDRAHLWVDRTQTVAYFFDGNNLTDTIDFSINPPPRMHFLLREIGWASDNFGTRREGRIRLSVNRAPWRDLGETRTFGLVDPGGASGTYTLDFNICGLNESDLRKINLDIGPGEVASFEYFRYGEGDWGVFQVRWRGWFYHAETPKGK